MKKGHSTEGPEPIHVAVFLAVSAWLSKNGVTPDDLARHLGEHSAESLKSRAGTNMYELALVLDAAAEIIDDDCLAVRIAADLDPRDFGVLGYLGLASRTLGEALHNLARYHPSKTRRSSKLKAQWMPYASSPRQRPALDRASPHQRILLPRSWCAAIVSSRAGDQAG
jgi:hypothetical protein